ncbi:MAG: tetratricopeptide repeat protein [Deltaproteobacteria bacterium]|nr:tetratricopeptide repeat protein [Deltaproteobacteria bacterium]
MAIPLDIKILIVGPDFIYRKNIRGMLEMLGFTNVEETLDGTSAWESIKSSEPDIVIAQWEMPEMNGMALLKLIRRDPDFSEIPVILWTIQITKADVIQAGEAGVNSILLESATVEHLERKIRIIMEFELSQNTREAKAHMTKGDMHLQEKSYAKALGEYQKVLEIIESAEVYYNIGYIKTAKGEYDEALAAFRKATQINQMFAKAYQAMAAVYLKIDNKDMAQKYLQMAGNIFLEREMHESAESIFNMILKINPETINVYNSLAILYRRQNRFKEAVSLYEKAIKINPKDENVLFNMGRAYLDHKNIQMAKHCFQKALKINPHFDIAKAMLKAIESTKRVDQSDITGIS